MFKLIIKIIKNLFSKSTVENDSKARKRNNIMVGVGLFLIAWGVFRRTMASMLFVLFWDRGLFGKMMFIVALGLLIFAVYTFIMWIKLTG